MPNLYTPIFGSECIKCEHSPVVGMKSKNGVHSTTLCGVCFFQDRAMVDEDLWNDEKDSTE